MAKNKEIRSVKIEATEHGVRQVFTGNSLPVIGKMFEEYQKAKESYEKEGYTISNENPEKFTFTATKEFDDDEN